MNKLTIIDYASIVIKTVFLYMYILCTHLINHVFEYFKYVRIYDLNTGKDMTLPYYIYNCFGRKIAEYIYGELIYEHHYTLGVCSYCDDRYIRYIVYFAKLMDVVLSHDDAKKRITSAKYHDIKKIELLKHNTKTNENITVDVTKAKSGFYDISNTHTRISDVVKFFRIIKGEYRFDRYTENRIKIQREYYDDDLDDLIELTEESILM